MKKIDLGQTVGILANIGILISIVFLAVETRQNQASLDEGNRISLISSRATAFEATSNFRLLMAENEEAVRIWIDGLAGTLSDPLDQTRFDFLCSEYFWRMSTNYERNSALGNQVSADANAQGASEFLSANPGVTRCWGVAREQMIQYGQVQFVEAVENGPE